MPHISLPEGVPGIVSLFQFRPETAGPLNELAEVLLRGPSTLSRGERELIAAFVSYRNNCYFCTTSHAAFARAQLDNPALADDVRADYRTAAISDKLKALLAIAERVQISGKEVTTDLVEAARAQGATDQEIHDTVLIAAAFCMYNRYVDGLATWAPTEPEVYEVMAKDITTNGYKRPALV